MTRAEKIELIRSRPQLSVATLSYDMGNQAAALKILQKNDVNLLHFDVMDGNIWPNITVGSPFVGGLKTELLKDATAHAEMIAITQAANAIGDWRLTDTILYVTKEPCVMCAGAIVLARIPTVVFGCPDPQRGGACSVFNVLDNPALNPASNN